MEHETTNYQDGYKNVIVQLDQTGRPDKIPRDKETGRVLKHQYVNEQKDWYDQAVEPLRESVRAVGGKVLHQMWLTSEMMVAVPDGNFDESVEALASTLGVTGWALHEPRPLTPDSDKD